MRDLGYLNKFFWKYKWRLLLGLIFIIIANVFGVLPPIVIRHAFDLVKENIAVYRMYDGFPMQQDFHGIFVNILLFFGVLVIILAVFQGIFTFLMRQTIIVMSRLIEYDLRNEIYNHYQELDQSFYKKSNTGDLMARITEDVSRVRMYLGPAIMYTINTVVLFIMVITVMIQVNAELTLYVLAPLPILSISIYYVSSLINKKSEAIQRQLSFLTTIAQETYSGIRVIKSYVQQKNYSDYLDKESENYKVKNLSLKRVEALFFPLMLLLIGLSTVITIYIGGIQVMQGKITTGNIAEFVIYVAKLTWPVTSIGWIASIVQRASASQKRINEFLDTKPRIPVVTGKAHLIKGQIHFHQVHFTYPDTGVEALKGIDFSLNPGEKMAVVGRTGTGKSTIADLLLRMYDPTRGTITIDGHDIREFSPQELRAQIGYVPQDVFLFSDTIANNIRFGASSNGKQDIADMARLASIHTEISDLPLQYETRVGERGVTLSGGQKQRISIARAFMKDPQILILDDCLSAVDASTERNILDSLKDALKEKTAIIITHRISSLLDFDKVIVLKDGVIAESGTHRQLMDKKGLYFDMYEQQRLEESLK